MATFGQRLKRIRTDNGMSQVELAKLINSTNQAISQYESGKRRPDYETLSSISDIFNVSVDYLLGKDDVQAQERVSRIPSRTVKINVYGRVAAGIPMEMIEDIYDEEEIPADWTRGGKEYFGLVIHGESMQPKMSEGDVVIARRQPDAETGDTVIATVNGFEATCKVLKKYPHGIELIPTNPTFDRMFYTNDEISSLPVTILGKVVELRAKF